jgi:FkbM family methyltransferase
VGINDLFLSYFIKKGFRGKDRLYTAFVGLGFRKLVITKAKYGIKLFVNPKEYIDNIIIKEGFYESEITDEILKQLKNGGVFWDIGANIGIHSIAVKRMLPGTTVYSFEPNPKTLGLLYENIALNKLDINVCGFALFNKAQVMPLHIVEGNSGMSTLTPWHEIKFTTTAQCLTTTGDALTATGYPLPTVIKLDTEGSELHVLLGCKETISNTAVRAVIFEAGNDFLDDNTGEMALLLKDCGFTAISSLSRNENTSHGLSNFVALKA